MGGRGHGRDGAVYTVDGLLRHVASHLLLPSLLPLLSSLLPSLLPLLSSLLAPLSFLLFPSLFPHAGSTAQTMYVGLCSSVHFIEGSKTSRTSTR